VCCSVLQCVSVCFSVVPYGQRAQKIAYEEVRLSVAGCCSVLQGVAVCCSLLQFAVVCCSVLQCVAVSYVRCDWFICEARPIHFVFHARDMTNPYISYVRPGQFLFIYLICEMSFHIHILDMWDIVVQRHSYAWYVRQDLLSWVRHDSFIFTTCETWLIHIHDMWDMTHSYSRHVRHDSFVFTTCETWLIHIHDMWDMTHSYSRHVRHESFVFSTCETGLAPLVFRKTQHARLLRETCLIHMFDMWDRTCLCCRSWRRRASLSWGRHALFFKCERGFARVEFLGNVARESALRESAICGHVWDMILAYVRTWYVWDMILDRTWYLHMYESRVDMGHDTGVCTNMILACVRVHVDMGHDWFGCETWLI